MALTLELLQQFCRGKADKALTVFTAQPEGLGFESYTYVRAKGPAICLPGERDCEQKQTAKPLAFVLYCSVFPALQAGLGNLMGQFGPDLNECHSPLGYTRSPSGLSLNDVGSINRHPIRVWAHYIHNLYIIESIAVRIDDRGRVYGPTKIATRIALTNNRFMVMMNDRLKQAG